MAHTREPPNPGRVEFDGRPRTWIRRYLTAHVGAFRKSRTAIAQFLAQYDRSPTLARLGAGAGLDRTCFVLATAVLVDELLDASRRRAELGMRRLGSDELTRARARALDRLRAAAATEAETLGAAWHRDIATRLDVRPRRIVPPRRIGHRVMYALDFALSSVPGLGVKERRRVVAQLVTEWTGPRCTGETVRVAVTQWRKRFRDARPACRRHPVAALYVPTQAALLTGLLGAPPPLGAHEACGRYHPAVAVQLCLPGTMPAAVARALRAVLIARLDVVGLSVLVPRASGGSRVAPRDPGG